MVDTWHVASVTGPLGWGRCGFTNQRRYQCNTDVPFGTRVDDSLYHHLRGWLSADAILFRPMGALMVLSSAARVVSIKLYMSCWEDHIHTKWCILSSYLQPSTSFLYKLISFASRSLLQIAARWNWSLFFWALQLTALHPTSTIFLEEPKPQLPVTAVVDSPFAATRHSAGVVKNYGYALAPKIVAPHLKELLDDPMVGSLMGWFMSLASPHY